MFKYRCLIVEDEPLAAEILEDYIQQVPQLELVGVCEDALFALEALQKQPIEVLFLDIHLPKLKGLDLLKILRYPPQVILTTAYHQYALQGYELNVVDYLLKPIEFSRFLQAVSKLKRPRTEEEVFRSIEEKQVEGGGLPIRPTRAFRFFNVNKRQVKVFLDEIRYIESLKEYVRIHLPERSLVTKFQIGEIEQLLEDENLLRIHRSYLIARDKIEAFSTSEVEVEGKRLPIGRSYKEVVMNALSEWSKLNFH